MIKLGIQVIGNENLVSSNHDLGQGHFKVKGQGQICKNWPKTVKDNVFAAIQIS